MTPQSKQTDGTERFTEVVESTDFQKRTILDLRLQTRLSDEHVPPLHSQVLEPPNLAERLFRGWGRQRQAQSDSTA